MATAAVPAPLIGADLALRMYEQMQRIRAFEAQRSRPHSSCGNRRSIVAFQRKGPYASRRIVDTSE